MSNFTNTELFSLIDTIQASGAEIVTHDPGSQRLFVTAGGAVEIFDMSIPSRLVNVGKIDISGLGANVNSVAVKNGLVAVAIEASVSTDVGMVAFFDIEGNFLNSVEVGALPDMLTFAPDDTTTVPSTFTFAVENFTGNDGRVLITLTQVGANVQITATVDGNVNPGDIAGLFFHLDDETLLSNLNITGADITDIEVGADSIINVNGINLNGRPSVNLGPYDVGIQIGEKGGQSVVSSTTLTISNVSIEQFVGQGFGVRLQSAGADGRGSSKLQGIADVAEYTLLVANEGEAGNGINPEGSVSIINVSGRTAASVSVTELNFNAFDSQVESLLGDDEVPGVRLFPDVISEEITVSQDLEPEYIAFSPDGTKAWVTLQENNAIAVVDLATATIEKIIPLGTKDFSQDGNGFDASDEDGEINIQTWPVKGLYMPDGIASFEADGETYYITANEGDARDEEIRVGQTEVQFLNLGGATEGTFTLTFDNAGTLETTTELNFDATDADIEAALEALDGISHVEIETVDHGFEIAFIGDLANTDVELLEITDNTLTGGTTTSVEVVETAYILDETEFPDALELKHPDNLGRLTVSRIDGDDDHDGDYDRIVAYGGRSFTIWDSEGDVVFDSGDQIAQITAQFTPDLFNSDDADADEFDTRSDNKGAEPENVVIGEFDGKIYAFIGLERSAGGVVIYDVSDPTEPSFVQYLQNAPDDISPEGLTFISADDSPTGLPMLAIANEESNTVSLYSFGVEGSAPEIENENIEFSIIEHFTSTTFISQVFATDIDNDEIKYVILDGNLDRNGDGRKAFSINSIGQIFIEDSTEIDFEYQSFYSLTIAAVDSVGLSKTATVSINIEDTEIDFSQDFAGNDDGIFLFRESTTLEISTVEINTSFTNQILYYLINEDGSFTSSNGTRIFASESNYLETIISESSFESGYTGVISSCFASDNPSGLPSGFSYANQTSTIEVSGGSRLGFLLIADGTVEEVRKGKSSKVFFSSQNGVSAEEFTRDSFSLKFKDKDDDDIFESVKLKFKSLPPGQAKKGTKLQRQSGLEVLDFTSETESVNVKITVNSEAAFSNFVGFCITNEYGDVFDQFGNVVASIGDENYNQAIVEHRLDISITQTTTVFNAIFAAGKIFTPFLISDATAETITDFSKVFTSFSSSFSSSVDYVRLIGDNVFGFEDQFGGGDRDYDDMIISCEVV